MKKKIKNKIPKYQHNDAIVFMTAYNINEYSMKISRFWKKKNTKELLNKFHISRIANKDTVVTSMGKLKYTAEFDSMQQVTKYDFKPCKKTEKIENYQTEINQMIWMFSFWHSSSLLLDTDLFVIDFCFDMQPFLVMINSEILQVDPVVFMMNGVLFVNYELIHYDINHPLQHGEIFGRSKNYNIIPVDEIKYFGEEKFIGDSRKICDIIFDNITGFIAELSNRNLVIDSLSYLHNTFVISNKVSSKDQYFQEVLGAELPNIELNNLSGTLAFEYYSQEYLGLITKYNEENIKQVLFDGQLLEAMKMYFCLKMIVDYEITIKLDDIVNQQIHMERHFYPRNAPIITLNAIENIKKTETYKRYKSALELKTAALKLRHERQQEKNGHLLNILLYLLALISSISTLQVLETELGLSFKISFWIVIIAFCGLGIYWIINERKH